MNIWIYLILLLVLSQPVAGLFCYFCSDTSSEKGRNQCQTWHRTMKFYRKKAETTGSYKSDKYVKNCTEYGEGEKFCMVASVEQNKGVKSFIRDCSDGQTFFSDDFDVYFRGDTTLPDNQTTCRYTGQGYLACVTLCGGLYGFSDFCNGPLSTATSLYVSLTLSLTSFFITLMNIRFFS